MKNYVLSGWLCLVIGTTAYGFDIFSMSQAVSATPAKAVQSTGLACQLANISLTQPLQPTEVVDRALCNHPQTRQAWANVKVQAAAVGVNQAAYLPTLNAVARFAREGNRSAVQNFPWLDSKVSGKTHDYTVNLNWVLFDFGLRSANLDHARELLAVAQFSQDATLQTVFLNAMQSYYDVLAKQSLVQAKLEAQKFAQQSFKAAEAKYPLGAAAFADKLQAQTAYSQAVLDQLKAQGELRTAQGTLAVAMGLPVNTALTLSTPEQQRLPDTSFVTAVDQLMIIAQQKHPSVLAAQAQLRAAQAKAAATNAQGRPSVTLVANVNQSDQVSQPYPNVPSTITRYNRNSVGIELNIPLFEGFSRTYQVQQAQAEVEVETAKLADTEQQVALDLWKNYQSLMIETENLKTTKDLSESAGLSFKVSQGRYHSGVGSMIELLNAQSSLADAAQQRIQAWSNWHNARLKLAGNLGQLGAEMLE